MVNLNENRFRQLLGNINQNPQMKDQYESKWYSVVHFLHNNVGYKIAKVAKAGSQAKHTESRNSDLDIIFSTTPNQNVNNVLNTIQDKAKKNYGKVANISKSKSVVQIHFRSPKCNIDVVYLMQNQFDKEHGADKNVGRIPQVKRDAIKLTKYAFYKSTGDLVKGYEIEKVCINSNCNSLIGCVNASIHYFNESLNQNGYSVNDVLKYLT